MVVCNGSPTPRPEPTRGRRCQAQGHGGGPASGHPPTDAQRLFLPAWARVESPQPPSLRHVCDGRRWTKERLVRPGHPAVQFTDVGEFLAELLLLFATDPDEFLSPGPGDKNFRPRFRSVSPVSPAAPARGGASAAAKAGQRLLELQWEGVCYWAALRAQVYECSIGDVGSGAGGTGPNNNRNSCLLARKERMSNPPRAALFYLPPC
jgi:hypothetical protein